jgi:diguanylate cyclase (GGDEF)-like protein/PAS domain S-box-containing protein
MLPPAEPAANHPNSSEPQPMLRQLLDSMAEGVYCVDPDRVITYWNSAAEQLTGYTREEVLGQSCKDNILVHCDAHGRILCETGCPLTATLKDGQKRRMEAFLKHRAGHRVAVSVRSAPLFGDDGSTIGVVETFNENADKLAALDLAESYRQLAFTDPLTGVANRLHAQNHLAEVVRRCRSMGVPASIALVDIDHFKKINDTQGHDAGDQALQVTVATLRNTLRAADFIGRWGGEEFLLVLEGCHLRPAAQISENCRALVEQSHPTINGAPIRISVSIGVTEILRGDTPQSALLRADRLLYCSKASGRNRVSFSNRNDDTP